MTALAAVALAAAAYAQRLRAIDARCAAHTERLAAIESQLIKTGALPHPNPEEHQP